MNTGLCTFSGLCLRESQVQPLEKSWLLAHMTKEFYALVRDSGFGVHNRIHVEEKRELELVFLKGLQDKDVRFRLGRCRLQSRATRLFW